MKDELKLLISMPALITFSIIEFTGDILQELKLVNVGSMIEKIGHKAFMYTSSWANSGLYKRE